MKVLFLDFDGVLHPSTEVLKHDLRTLALRGSQSILDTGMFRWAGLLEDALKLDAPVESGGDEDIAIVIHSSWRNEAWLSTEMTRAILGPLGHRFIGFTSRFVGREQSIEDFVERIGVQNFLILDDAVAEFDTLKSRLVVANPLKGVSDEKTTALIHDWARTSHPARSRSPAESACG